MASFNKVILVGNLTRDPQVRYTSGGSAVSEIGLAVNRTWYDKQANAKREETTFVDVTLWGRQAEVAGEYLAKGRSVLIEGRLQLDQWEDKQSGEKRSKLRVVGENMTMLGGGGSGGGGMGGGGGRSQGASGGSRQGGRNQGGGNQGGGGSYQSAPADSFDEGGGDDFRSPADSFYDDGPPDEDVPF